MEIMDFCQKVRKSLSTCIGEKVTVNVKRIVKNNGIVLHSIVVSEKEMNISPNIYLDDLYKEYEEGETFRVVMDEVLRIYEESRMKENMDMSFFLDYENMKEQVIYKVISYEKNQELLRQVPHIVFLDLAIVFYCHVPKRELGSATILIYNNHLDMWKITKEQLYQDARRNTPRIMPARLLSMEEVVQELFLQDIKEERKEAVKEGTEETWTQKACEQLLQSLTGDAMDGKMYVLGNRMKLFGAAVLLYEHLLERIADKIGKNLFILPSSIHEVLLIPDDEEQEAEELWKMVCEINATEVEPEDVLTDSIYYFSRKTQKMEKLF